MVNFFLPSLSEQNQTLNLEHEETYQAFLRSLRRHRGFGIIFVRCTPIQEKEIIERIKNDVPNKQVDTLILKHKINKLYNLIAEKFQNHKPDILFISGIDKSLVDDIKPGGIGGQGDYYRLDTVPPILSHLNLQRERFRDNFKTCFVFFVPLFALKYILRRSPDFYDWRSGVFEFAQDKNQVNEESLRYVSEGDYEKYLLWTPQQRQQKIWEIEDLIAEKYQTAENKATLWFEIGNIYLADKNWEEAIQSYDQVLELKPNDALAWNNRGVALRELVRIEEAIQSYDKVIESKPDFYAAYNNRGNALDDLGRIEEAIQSYNKALEVKPDDDAARYNRGIALYHLGKLQEAIQSFDQALEIDPEYANAYYYKAFCHALQENIDLALSNLQQAIALNEQYREIAKTDTDFDKIRSDQRFQELISDQIGS